MLRDLVILPGIATIPTDRGAKGRWKSGDKVRFMNGLPQQLGGWQKATANSFLGKVRGVNDWNTLAFQHYIGAGSHLKLYVELGGTFNDITPLRAFGTLGANPLTTQTGSKSVSVHHIGHATAVGDFVHFSGAVVVGGITVDGEYTVTSIIGGDDYTITHSIAATSSVAGGGGATVAYKYEIHIGTADSIFGLGWGAGAYGAGTYGTPRTVSSFLQRARTWKLENWGEDLIANYRGGGIYLWDASVGTGTRAAVISGAPSSARGIFISPENRILVAYGAHDGSVDDPMLIRWSDSEDYNNFATDPINNTAGSKRLDRGSELIAHAKTRGGVLIFSDAFCWMQTFDGPPDIFGWHEVGSNGAIVGPNAAVEDNGIVFWMGVKNFFIYDGSIRVLPCDVHNHVFENLNFVQKDKVFAGVNLFFSEVWWLYPSGSSLECDRYVLYNYREGVWSIGTLNRTAFVGNSSIFQTPYAFGTDGFLYDHDLGVNADGAPMQSTLDSGDVEIGEGDQLMRLQKLVPDFKVLDGSVSVTLKGKKYPQRTEQFASGPHAVTASTAYINPRMRARQISLSLSCNELGANWRAGAFRMELRPSGRR